MTEPASSSPLARARLELLAGELVGDVEVLPYVRPARVLLWGARVFVLDREAEGPDGPIPVYVEAPAAVGLRLLPPVLEEVAP